MKHLRTITQSPLAASSKGYDDILPFIDDLSNLLGAIKRLFLAF